ncbi:MAG: undecaprenyldiphospho-muramoylpentapeptide beta-N-acetylglucosaminyltransferase [Clostridiales bacterium]|jgi:UDP-N-acetylglucosamine--N-acetylmuramyl-(pentapeptide) pyrophosphoryl-undecaprenol N-acetylglucosamine transferase|nr:undecaprenyldiphospho-muramoylpentapeptide beta-N-acetylglucosaminyltransferase [Clostridiales bacterium]
MKKIVMTGGGTAGHVTPNIALFDSLKAHDYNIYYIGSRNGIEKTLVQNCNIPYYGIDSGKMRRYFDIKNFTDIFRVIKGFGQALTLLKKINPDIVFSKGGFVTAPVVLAAKTLNIPVVLHESDITPGLANRINIPFSKAVCTSFPETKDHIKSKNVYLTGTPIRESLYGGNPAIGMSMCNFSMNKPVLLVMGGSLGSVKINTLLRESLNDLLKSYNIVHLCGKNNIDPELTRKEGYAQFEYINEEFPHIFAMANIVISRAGANSIYELLALKKPNILIPLTRAQSRGDQILNAESFLKQGFSKVLYEENITAESFRLEIIDLYSNREKYIETMDSSRLSDGVSEVTKVILRYTKS